MYNLWTDRQTKYCINGFTLAEVLVTLAVIGVLAALWNLTVTPAIEDITWHSYAKQAASMMNDVGTLIKMDHGNTLKGAFANSTDMNNQIASKLNVTKKCNNDTSCWHQNNNWFYMNKFPIDQNRRYGGILINGAIYSIWFVSSVCGDTTYTVPPNTKNLCGWMFVDMNGFKPPNTFGKDIFVYFVNEDRILPFGTQGYTQTNTCSTGSNGVSCASDYITGKK